MNLQAVADYFRTGKTSRALLLVLKGVTRVFSFAAERANRLARFLRVVRAYRAGKPVNDIVSEYGCSRTTVLRYARMSGCPKRPKSEDPERRAKIIMLSRTKPRPSQKRIASLCNCSVALVSIVESEAGLPRYRKNGGSQ